MKLSRETTVEVSINGNGKALQLLPGSEYETVLMPLDYPPSMDYNPRWGHSKPLNSKLLELLNRDSQYYLEAIKGLKELESYFRKIPATFNGQSIGWIGGAMNPIDLAIYYYYIIKSKPKKIIEIGSGISTRFARQAINDFQLQTKLISIDPNPRAEIDAICDQTVRNGLETMESLELFHQLEPGDIVFLDGSHRSFMNSDVTVFFMDIVPYLKNGVIIHIHDIHLPYDYSLNFKYWYWNEQYMLGTYLLAAANQLQILFPGHFVCTDERLSIALSEHTPDINGVEARYFRGAGSFWFTKRYS